MVDRTVQFIKSLDMMMRRNIINKNNIVVFDETLIGDDGSAPQVIGEKKGSAGDNINVVRTREKALGCYIPFSMVDGSTPFRVSVFKTSDVEIKGDLVTVLQPKEETGRRGDPHRVVFHTQTGYVNKEGWTTTRPGLHCFLICDNLPAHRNNEIVSTARVQGIHILHIMPGSSHWFQVHDQLPFATLKKKMNAKKNEILTSTSLPHEERRAILFRHLLWR